MASKLKDPSELPVTAADMLALNKQIFASAQEINKTLEMLAIAIEKLVEKTQG